MSIITLTNRIIFFETNALINSMMIGNLRLMQMIIELCCNKYLFVWIVNNTQLPKNLMLRLSVRISQYLSSLCIVAFFANDGPNNYGLSQLINSYQQITIWHGI